MTNIKINENAKLVKGKNFTKARADHNIDRITKANNNTVANYLANLGKRVDLNYDIAKGFLVIKS